MTTTAQPRVDQGVPAGGQYTAVTHAEPDLALTAPVSDLRDADGTAWDTDGDEYTDVWTTSQGNYELRVSYDIRCGDVYYAVHEVTGRDRNRVSDGFNTGTVEEAKAAAKADRARMASYGHNVLKVGSRGMRGKITRSEELSPGIDIVVTEGHGYVVLTGARNAEIDPTWREQSGWYERDCAWTIPVITHHRDLLQQSLVRRSHEEARLYFPEQYNAVVGADPARYGLTEFTPAAVPGQKPVPEKADTK